MVVNPDGTFSYTPLAGFVGIDTFTYTICDDDTPATCDTATVTVEVIDEGDPVAVDDGDATTPFIVTLEPLRRPFVSWVK